MERIIELAATLAWSDPEPTIHPDAHRNFALSDAPPFEKPISWYQTAIPREQLLEAGLLVRRLAARVDQLISDCRLSGPGRHEAPTHRFDKVTIALANDYRNVLAICADK